MQFRVEFSGGGEETEIAAWVPHIFEEKPIRPGHWKFTWEPGYGADCWIHEQVSFDRKRQLFIDHQKITPYPDIPLQAPKKKD